MKQSSEYSNKLNHLAAAIIFFLIIIVSRLVYLQIIVSHNFFALSVKNFLRVEPITSLRGNIYDCNGILLATNRPITLLYWLGSGNKKLTEEQLKVIEQIAHITQQDATNVVSSIIPAERTATKTMLASDITFEQLSKITERFPNNKNIFLTTHYKRFYPHKKVASHILGHIHTMDKDIEGKMGLEKILHHKLQGKEGKLLKTINSVGSNIKETSLQEALAGENIHTTIDLSLQLLGESLFPEAYSGTLLVVDPKNGAIKTLISRPSFDPTIFLDTISLPDWQALQQGKPFLNRAFDTCYPPASIFKLITISTAIEEGIISPDDALYCPGYFNFCGRRYYCDKRSGHGQLTVKEAVAKSCNILFYYIATKTSVDLLAEYARRFGFGTKTNIVFPEKSGLVPSSSWKLQEKGERWWQGETLSCAIGQSYLLATPLQIACMISSIFEGYLVTPRILENEPVIYRELDLSDTTRKLLKKYLRLAVKIGTCSRLNTLEDIKIYAKTGTAQTCSLSHKHIDKNAPLAHAWFVCYYHVKDEDPLTLVILVENAGTSRVATSIAKEFLTAYRSQKRNLSS